MSRMTRISSLIQYKGSELNQIGLTEEVLENLVADGSINGKYDPQSGELMIDRESICDYINQSSHSSTAELEVVDELDEMEDYFSQPEWDFDDEGLN